MPEGVELFLSMLVGGILAIFSFAMMTLWFSTVTARWRALRRFQPVEAVVLSQRALEHIGTEDTCGSSYSPEIEYRYSVAGIEHRSKNVWPGGDVHHLSLVQTEQILREYPTGQTVRAFCDPDDPSRAFLVRRLAASQKIGCAIIGWMPALIWLGFAIPLGYLWMWIVAFVLAVAFGIYMARWQSYDAPDVGPWDTNPLPHEDHPRDD